MNFESLVGHINQVQDVLLAGAAHAVNLSANQEDVILQSVIAKLA